MKDIERWKSRAFICILSSIGIFVNASHTRWTPQSDQTRFVAPPQAPAAPVQSEIRQAVPMIESSSRPEPAAYSSTSLPEYQTPFLSTPLEPAYFALSDPWSLSRPTIRLPRRMRAVEVASVSHRPEHPVISGSDSRNRTVSETTNMVVHAEPFDRRPEKGIDEIRDPRFRSLTDAEDMEMRERVAHETNSFAFHQKLYGNTAPQPKWSDGSAKMAHKNPPEVAEKSVTHSRSEPSRPLISQQEHSPQPNPSRQPPAASSGGNANPNPYQYRNPSPPVNSQNSYRPPPPPPSQQSGQNQSSGRRR